MRGPIPTLTEAKREKVCELAERAKVPDGFDPFNPKEVRVELKKHTDAAKALARVFAIIAPKGKPKAKAASSPAPEASEQK